MTITIMRGLPGSGKTTTARTLIDENTVRVNRDAIREMLHFGGIKITNEILVKDIEVAAACIILRSGRNLIIDDTNIGPILEWETMAKELGVEIIVRHVSTDALTSVRRYREREKSRILRRIFGPVGIFCMEIRRKINSVPLNTPAK